MNKYQLQSRIRSVGLAYILLFIAGAHYAYLNKWGTQVLFWITLGGLGIWWLIDIFRLAGMVNDFNDPIFEEIAWIERNEWYAEENRDDFSELERKHEERQKRDWERRERERQERQRQERLRLERPVRRREDHPNMDDFV